MRATPLTRLAYRSQGGSLETRSGTLTGPAAKAELNGLYALAQHCLSVGDTDGATFCGDMIEQLGEACQAVCAWARAA